MTEASGEQLISQHLACLLKAYGVDDIFASPGTRNAPLIAAAAYHDGMRLTMIVDERTAAFVALGNASVSGRPAALICTSGSALLNYGPALAEASYRHIPLIAFTADRPAEVVDRNDGQTIRQPGALAAVVKGSYSLDSRDDARKIDLILNDALTTATVEPCGPVHINIAIGDPTVSSRYDISDLQPRKIMTVQPSFELPKESIREIAARLASPCRVMVAAGHYPPDERLNRALNRLSTFGNFAILAEAGSNLHGKSIIDCYDTLIATADRQIITPDLLITYGQPLLSSRFKSFVRDNNIEHWHVGLTYSAFDTFGTLTRSILSTPESFFSRLCAEMRRSDTASGYGPAVVDRYREIKAVEDRNIRCDEWCDLAALADVVSAIPSTANIQLSNGMTARYAQHLHLSRFHRVDYNRGVSGIEGSTSTAIGASTAYNGMTLLITGDMSARYDISSLGLRFITPRFKMVVINNCGGQIFRLIKPTRHFDRREECLCANDPFPVEEISRAWGFRAFVADDRRRLLDLLPEFIGESSRPAILIVNTPAEAGPQTFNQ